MKIKNDILVDIIRGLKSGDKRLKERIYKYYWGYLMGVAVRYLSDRDLAREVVNDSFMKAFNTLDRFTYLEGDDFNRMFKAWLAKITVRTALNELRKRKMALYSDNLSEDYDQGYVDTNFDRLNVEAILGMLDQLTPVHKAVFNLYEIEGYSHDEIGELLHISSSSSRVYLGRAKDKLRKLYHESFGEVGYGIR